MHASSSSSSSPSATPSVSDPTHGSTAPRYVLPFPNPPIHLTTQIFPTYIRAKGINICASAGAIGSIVVGQFFPVGIQNIGSKTYFIFFAINVASMVIMIIWYPETKGKTLEEMDGLFGKLIGGEGDMEHGREGGGRNKAQDDGDEVERQAVEAGKR